MILWCVIFVKDLKKQVNNNQKSNLFIQKIGEYNSTVGKRWFINSLSKNEIISFDKFFAKNIPIESQIVQRKYSIDSDICNDYYRLSGKDLNKLLLKKGISIHEIEQDIENLKIIY